MDPLLRLIQVPLACQLYHLVWWLQICWDREQLEVENQKVRGYLEKLIVWDTWSCKRLVQGCWNGTLLWGGWLSSAESRWQLEKFSTRWKKFKVMLLFLSSKNHLPNNRLISLTLVSGKVLEHIFLESISSLLRDKKIIRNRQPANPA